MSHFRYPLLLTVLLIGADTAGAQVVLPARRPVIRPGEPEPVVDQAVADKKALEQAGLREDDPAGLLGYIRQRTLSDTDLSRIQAVIRKFGADDFDERIKASYEAERFGPAAVAPLRNAWLQDADPEVAHRAGETLKRLEKVPHAAVAAAAVRALSRLRPPDAAAVLLAYLPMADTEQVADEIRATLTAIAVKDGKAEPALVAALTDPSPVRRAAAGVALLTGGPAAERIRIKDAYPAVRQAAAAEKDPETRFQLLYALLTVAREKEAVGQLIDALPVLPRGRLWQAEDYLIQLAGPEAPKAVLGKTKESLAKARDAWHEWLARAGGGFNLEAFAYTPRIQGKTLLVLMDHRFGTGSVVELGPDLKEKWRIAGLHGPMDAQFTADGDVAIAEQNSNRVTVRDARGQIKATKTIGGANRIYGNPQQIQVLPNGNLLVTCRNVVAEFAKDKDEIIMSYPRNNTYDISAAHRLPNGETLVLLQNTQDHALFIDAKGKELPERKLKTGMPVYQSAQVSSSGDDRVLVTEQNQVAEYDLTKNAVVWKKQANQPRSAQRLPNGNTLFVAVDPTDANNPTKLVEVTPDGEEVWSYKPTNGMQLFRGYRR